MADEKSQRLGLRGRLAHFESALRLIGGANATGVIAAGAAFHAFAQNANVQSSVKLAAVLFLFGIFAFVVAYLSWFVTVEEIDHSLHKTDDPLWPEYLFWTPSKTAEEYQSSAKKTFIVMIVLGFVSFIFFFIGFANVLLMAIRLQLGPN
jgi:hypothetical protein